MMHAHSEGSGEATPGETVDSVDSAYAVSDIAAKSCGTFARKTGLVPTSDAAVDFVDSVDSVVQSAVSVKDLYAEGGEWHYADSITGRCFDILQNEKHPDTGVILLTAERIENALGKRPNDRYSWVFHDQDKYVEEDLKNNPRAALGQDKAPHFHIAEKRRNKATVGQVARAYGVPPQCVKARSETAFLDLVEYQTHEHPRQQALGKHLYADSEIHANFQFREELDKHVAKRGGSGSVINGGGKQSAVDRLALRIQEEGLTLRMAKDEDPLSFNRALSRMEKSRGTYLRHLPPPSSRINFYFEGEGGVGKDLLAKALARTLVPGEWVPGEHDPFFTVGGENVTMDGYDGQPVIIFEEARAGNLIRSMGRKELFAFLNPFPEKQSLSIKYGATQPVNTVTIFTGPDDFNTFLDGLAGEYVDKSGEKHKAENKPQTRRRIPIIIPVREGSFDLLVNKGFADNTRDFMEYYEYRNIRQSIEQVQIRTKGIIDAQRRVEVHRQVEAGQVAPIVEQYHRVLEVKTSKDEDPDALVREFADLGKEIPEEELDARLMDQFLDAQRAEQQAALEALHAAEERCIQYTLHRLRQHQAGYQLSPLHSYRFFEEQGGHWDVTAYPIVGPDGSPPDSGKGGPWVMPLPALEAASVPRAAVGVDSHGRLIYDR